MRPLEGLGGFLLFGGLSTGVSHCSRISTGFAVNFDVKLCLVIARLDLLRDLDSILESSVIYSITSSLTLHEVALQAASAFYLLVKQMLSCLFEV
jgi:hypothetical protein